MNKLEYAKDYYERNKDKILEQKKEYREKNKERIKEYNKEYRAKNREELNRRQQAKRREARHEHLYNKYLSDRVSKILGRSQSNKNDSRIDTNVVHGVESDR